MKQLSEMSLFLPTNTIFGIIVNHLFDSCECARVLISTYHEIVPRKCSFTLETTTTTNAIPAFPAGKISVCASVLFFGNFPSKQAHSNCPQRHLIVKFGLCRCRYHWLFIYAKYLLFVFILGIFFSHSIVCLKSFSSLLCFYCCNSLRRNNQRMWHVYSCVYFAGLLMVFK